jgi:hypothetical protein
MRGHGGDRTPSVRGAAIHTRPDGKTLGTSPVELRGERGLGSSGLWGAGAYAGLRAHTPCSWVLSSRPKGTSDLRPNSARLVG